MKGTKVWNSGERWTRWGGINKDDGDHGRNELGGGVRELRRMVRDSE